MLGTFDTRRALVLHKCKMTRSPTRSHTRVVATEETIPVQRFLMKEVTCTMKNKTNTLENDSPLCKNLNLFVSILFLLFIEFCLANT